jgi:transposase
MSEFLNSLWQDRARLLQGAAVGAALTVALGFNWIGGYGFNWSTGGNAQRLALTASTDAMIPICVDQFLALGPDVQAEYKNIRANDREDVVRKHIKKVGAVTVDFSFARACASANRHPRPVGRQSDVAAFVAGIEMRTASAAGVPSM